MSDSEGIVGEYMRLHEGTDADLLAMQCGDFYEFFGEDARTVADELDLKISEKASHGSTHAMAGVPLSELTPYLKGLTERGYRVAVATQYETNGGHERRVDRVVSPGTVLEPDEAAARYLAAVVSDGDGYGLAFTDVTTGRCYAGRVANASEARAQLDRFDPVELLPGPETGAAITAWADGAAVPTTHQQAAVFAPGRARRRVREQFGDASRAVGIDDEAAITAVGATLTYVEESDTGVLRAISRIASLETDTVVHLDATTRRNLELTETMRGDREGSLLATVDHTETAAGARRLREWLTAPTRDREEITRRHDAIESLTEAAMVRDGLAETLSDTADLERLASRATSGSVGPRGLAALRDALQTLPALADTVAGMLEGTAIAEVIQRPDHEAASDLYRELDAALPADPGPVGEGAIAEGYDDDLDGIVENYEEATDWIESLADRVKDEYNLTHVSVGRTKTDGYYVQVGKSEAGAMPDQFREIKTLKNSRRFVTDELAERERDALRFEESRREREQELIDELRESVVEAAEIVQSVGRTLAEVDALVSLATHAVSNDWCRPELGEELSITAGRHPTVEQTTEFVPNDLRMDDDREFLIVTGPNMSGKSTYMRQCALIVLLAQAGSFVPAGEAGVPVVDGIYTRVGALDELAQGRSTFMVEMQELSNILHSATADSLVVLDEVGRGTATYDGISIAWAATEYLHNQVRAKTLFATHYHELTTLAEHLPRVANVHVAVDGEGDDVTFLRRVREGPTDRSYGVHVADMAGVPTPVVDRAGEVLDRLREDEAIETRGAGGGDEPTQAVFDLSAGEFTTKAHANGGHAGGANGASANGDAASGESGADGERLDPETEAVLAELQETAVEETSPLELMSRVKKWQDRVE